MFGERGVIYNRPRAATIVCLDNESELAVMDKTDFNFSFGKIQKIEENRKTSFFDKYVTSEEGLNLISKSFSIMFEREVVAKDTLIKREGQHFSKMWILYSGQISK